MKGEDQNGFGEMRSCLLVARVDLIGRRSKGEHAGMSRPCVWLDIEAVRIEEEAWVL